MHIEKMQVISLKFSEFFHLFYLFLRKSLEKNALRGYLMKQQTKWWLWRSWLARLVVAQKVAGSSPVYHPIFLPEFRAKKHEA